MLTWMPLRGARIEVEEAENLLKSASGVETPGAKSGLMAGLKSRPSNNERFSAITNNQAEQGVAKE